MAVILSKNSILSIVCILIQATATKRLSLLILHAFGYEMPMLPYSKHKNKYCGCIYTIITEERGLLYNQLCRQQFISYHSKVKYAKWKVEFALRWDKRAPSNLCLMSCAMF